MLFLMAIAKRDRDLVALTVLALLQTGPRHAYEMLLMVERTHKTFVTGLPRSIYHATNRLSAAGLIAATGTERDGALPERTVYELTAPGRVRLSQWVRLLLEEPDIDSALFGPALTYAASLQPTDVARALELRRTKLRTQLDAITASRQGLVSTVPRALLLELEYHSSRIEAEIDWVTRVLGDLAVSVLSWPADASRIADIDLLIAEEDAEH